MRVCITEKPSVAKDIAAVLGATTKRDGYYEGAGDWRVTWTFGHLCTLKEPADYTPLWKRWSLGALPMIPPKFGIKLIDDEGIRHQFEVIRSLISQADEVVNCGDAGMEGELIQRWVMQLADTRCPVRRLWISSLTDEAIRQGFRDLRPAADYDNLYYAGLSRSAGDWLLGMNATRLYSLKYGSGYGSGVLSIGRVQTPTLALIVQRHHEIANFRPRDYWELKTVYRGVTFAATSGKFDTEAEAQRVVESIAAVPYTVDDVQQKRGRETPERLFDLTSLQVECNRRWGWTADETLSLIQSLYEKKLTTYPRVDTTCLPDDVYPKVPDILRRMTPYAPITAPLLAPGYKIPKSKKVFDNAKVTDHHAIIPTGESPAAAVGRERQMYHLIARRFIAAFYPDCVFNTTTVLGHAADVRFKATGKVIISPGWREIYLNDKPEAAEQEHTEQKEAEAILPDFTPGESGPHEPALVKKTTSPPKYYTEGTLLRAMETAGKTVDDEELRDALKENGIGRPSTRANIIETLFKRRYIYRERKNIMASQAGIDLIGLIHEELIKSAKLTGIWENKLRQIERGEYPPEAFMDELKEMVSRLVIDVLSDNSSRRIVSAAPDTPDAHAGKEKSTTKPKAKRAAPIRKFEQVRCPACGMGHILKGRSAFGCSRYAEGCSFRVPFSDATPESITPSALNRKINKSR